MVTQVTGQLVLAHRGSDATFRGPTFFVAKSTQGREEGSRLPNRLEIAEFANSIGRQFSSVTGILDPSEREFRVADRHAIDEHRTGLDLVSKPRAFPLIVCPSRRTQPEVRGVCEFDCVINIAYLVEGGDGTKRLFGVNAHVGGHVRNDGGREEESWAVWGSTTSENGRAFGDLRPRRV